MPRGSAQDILDTCAKVLAKYPLCDRCLGRQFRLLDERDDNQVIGSSLKLALYLENSSPFDMGGTRPLRVLKRLALSGHRPSASAVKARTGKAPSVEPCPICGGSLFTKIRDLALKSASELRKYQYATFQLGSKLPRKIVRLDDEIKMIFKLPHGESVKTEFNRLLANELSKATGSRPVFSGEADIAVTFDPISESAEVSPSPLYISGRYRKLKPGTSQTRKRGVSPLTSIEGMLASVFVPLLKAEDVKFHGAGREDVDALMLGRGRPFVLEVVRPRKRRIGLARAQREFNERFKKSVQVGSLKLNSRASIVKLKLGGERFDKRYRIIIRVEEMPSEEKLREVEKMSTNLMIEQRTPKRVAWRRADKVRKKRIRSLKLKRIGRKRLEAVMETQAGTYVKEFITGDEGRTRPSLAELLNTPANWEALEVLQILGG